VLASPLRCHAFNGFIRRPDLKVVGEDVPMSALSDYAEQCLARCRRLGASVGVWGSAASRKVPAESVLETVMLVLHIRLVSK